MFVVASLIDFIKVLKMLKAYVNKNLIKSFVNLNFCNRLSYIFSFFCCFLNCFLKSWLFFASISFINAIIQLINFITISLNNWYNILMFINVCALQSSCFQIELFIKWMIIKLSSFFKSRFERKHYFTSFVWVYSCVRYFHFLNKFCLLFNKILQIFVMSQWSWTRDAKSLVLAYLDIAEFSPSGFSSENLTV